MQRSGENQARIILQARFKRTGCFHCKQETHTYHNCPSRPCFVCNVTGHMSMLCPFKPKTISKNRRSQQSHSSTYNFIRARELTSTDLQYPSRDSLYKPLQSAHVSYIAEKIHVSRISAAEWMPDGSAILTGDKKGILRIFKLPSNIYNDNGKFDVTQFNNSNNNFNDIKLHRCNINSLAFDVSNRNVVYSTSGDGTLRSARLDHNCDGNGEMLFNFNPDGFSTRSTWKMAHGLTYDADHKTLYTGSSHGSILRIDPRSHEIISHAKFHNGKVTCVNINPYKSNLLVTASNDKKVCLWDIRKFIPNSPLGTYIHDRVVSSACFSPISGSKLLTTSFDNRIRLWNDINQFQGDCNSYIQSQPDKTIIHSHNCYRYLSPFKSVWDPKDWSEDTFMCGRFLGETYTDHTIDSNIILKPIDIFSAKSGHVKMSLVDRSVQLTCTINKFCPVSDVVLTAASRGIYLWSCQHSKNKSDDDKRRGLVRGGGGDGGEDNDDGDDGDDGSGGKKKKRKMSMKVTHKIKHK